MNVAGETIYIVCAAPHVAAVWRNSSTISLDPISMRMYTWIGVSKENREKLFIPHEKAKYNEGNQRALTPTQMMIELHHRQVHPGPRFDQHFEKKTLPALFDNLDLTTKEHPAVVEKSDSSVTVSLLKLCMQVFIKGQTDALWGQAIWKVEPELLNLFMTWEHTNWKYLFHLPWFLSQDMLNAKDKLVDAFTKYLCIPPAERRDAGYFAQASESMLREVGLSEREIGGIIMLHYWA
jgi:cholesterol 7alpha-monooxygenase